MNRAMTGFPPLPSNFIVYDHGNPSPYFPPEKVAYIESINNDFSEEELQQIRAMERFAFNLNTEGVGGDEIPGIRNKQTEAHVYFKRFSDDPWKVLVQTFMDSIPDGFEDKGRCLMPMCRATLPNGDRYYPMTVLGNLGEWQRRLLQAAADCGTKLGWFDKGKFVVSDGQIVGFSDLRWDRLLRGQRSLRDW